MFDSLVTKQLVPQFRLDVSLLFAIKALGVAGVQ